MVKKGPRTINKWRLHLDVSTPALRDVIDLSERQLVRSNCLSVMKDIIIFYANQRTSLASFLYFLLQDGLNMTEHFEIRDVSLAYP